MKKLSIYECYVEITSQEQADRMKQLCVDYGLEYWNDEIAFNYFKKSVFAFSDSFQEFFLYYKRGLKYNKSKFAKTTESEFIELLKTI